MSTATVTSGTRPRSLQNEAGLCLSDFTLKPSRTHNDVLGPTNNGDNLEWRYSESSGLITDISFTGSPIPDSSGALQGLCILEDTDTVTSLVNFIDDDFFGIDLSVGTIVCRDTEMKRAKSGTGCELSFNLKHGHALN